MPGLREIIPRIFTGCIPAETLDYFLLFFLSTDKPCIYTIDHFVKRRKILNENLHKILQHKENIPIIQ